MIEMPNHLLNCSQSLQKYSGSGIFIYLFLCSLECSSLFLLSQCMLTGLNRGIRALNYGVHAFLSIALTRQHESPDQLILHAHGRVGCQFSQSCNRRVSQLGGMTDFHQAVVKSRTAAEVGQCLRGHGIGILAIA